MASLRKHGHMETREILLDICPTAQSYEISNMVSRMYRCLSNGRIPHIMQKTIRDRRPRCVWFLPDPGDVLTANRPGPHPPGPSHIPSVCTPERSDRTEEV